MVETAEQLRLSDPTCVQLENCGSGYGSFLFLYLWHLLVAISTNGDVS